MIFLGNIALVLKGPSFYFNSQIANSYHFSLSFPSFSFGSKRLLCLVLMLTWLRSSSDDGVKNLANSLTWDGPTCLRGSSLMSCNLSPVSESLLFLQRAMAFSACTCFLDPMSLECLQINGGSGTLAAGGAKTGLGWFCGYMATCFSMAIHCCWSRKLSI